MLSTRLSGSVGEPNSLLSPNKEEQKMSEDQVIVYAGVDTHRDVHVAAVVDTAGRILGTSPFPTDETGYEQLKQWLRSQGHIARVGVVVIVDAVWSQLHHASRFSDEKQIGKPPDWASEANQTK